MPWAAQQLTTRDLYVSCRGEVIPFTVELRGDLENDADFVADEIFGRTACADEPLEARRAVVLEGLRDERRRPSSRSHTPLRLLRSLPDRDGLPRLLADLGYAGTGAEVGTHRGEFAAKLLNGSALSELHLVDLWAAVDFYDADRAGDVAATRAAVAPYGRRAELREGLASLDAARAFPDGSLDFVYLDAEHTYSGVRGDLEAWWPKLRRGGLFAGNDYHAGWVRPAGYYFGTKDAVDEFFLRADHRVYATTTSAIPTAGEVVLPDWYVLKCAE